MEAWNQDLNEKKEEFNGKKSFRNVEALGLVNNDLEISTSSYIYMMTLAKVFSYAKVFLKRVK